MTKFSLNIEGDRKHNSVRIMIARVAVVCLVIFQFGFFESTALSIAAEKCREYAKLFNSSTESGDQKGNCNPRTFEGDRFAKPGEFPYMAALKYLGAHGKFLYSCTAVLISDEYLLAPAYCTEQSVTPVSVKLGYFNIHDADLGPYGQEINVIKLIPHPAYSRPNLTDVLTLIKLEKKVKFNKFVHPICLHEEFAEDGEVMASGWNLVGTPKNYDEKKYVGQLLKSTYTVFHQNKCKYYYRKLNHTVTDEQFCVGVKEHQCTLEPTGTVQTPNKDVPCMDSLVGLENYGPVPCKLNKFPDVYTRISPYIRWIETIVWE